MIHPISSNATAPKRFFRLAAVSSAAITCVIFTAQATFAQAQPPAAPILAASVRPDEHPLLPVLRWAERDLPAVEALNDYSAVLVRRERVHGVLGGYENMYVKVRHRPFSVYALFQAPGSVKGQEVIYVAGQHRGEMLAHKARMPVTFSLNPEGLVAMSGRRYPLTEIGLVNLVNRLVEVGREDIERGECEVNYFPGAKVAGRDCTVIEVVHPVQRDYFRFHLARIFVDDELRMPIRYESHDWPDQPDGKLKLIEEFTYLDLKLNNGFTDLDFDVRNPEYHFERTSPESNLRADSR